MANNMRPLLDNARVLLAEDEPITRMDLAQMLLDMGAAEVCQCGRGDQAIKFARQKKWDLVLLDVKMPVIDGLTATEHISKRMLAPVVLLTAHEDEETVDRALKSGALIYLVKPVEPQRLLAAAQLAIAQFAELKKVAADVLVLRGKKAEQQTVDQAKKILQQQWGMNEEQAYSYIRRQSMHHQQKMTKIAEEILAGRIIKPVDELQTK